jgi:peptidoglycan/xylan/chitin deacetylase (PgdA/CDA1 family)
MLKVVTSWMSPAGPNARLSILIFHRVLSARDPLFPEEIDAPRFDQICRWLKASFNVLPLDAAVASLKAGTLPQRAACITFDDGYADNFRVAMPILQQQGLTATFFIATGFLDGGRMWNDTIIAAMRDCRAEVLDLRELDLGRHPLQSLNERGTAILALIRQLKHRPVQERATLTEQIALAAQVQLPVDLMMTSAEVLAMRRGGMQIGAHTVSHPILATLTAAQAREEVESSKQSLEQLLGERVGLFAYPNGKPVEDYTSETVEVIRSLDFDAAVSTAWGASTQRDDMFQLRRFTPWDKTRSRFGLRMLSNLRVA